MTYAEWRSRGEAGREERFRNAVRVNMDALRSDGDRISAWATDRLAEALVETANRQGYFPLRPGAWHEQSLDYGAGYGMTGEVIAVFTATKDQFIRWLEHELEERDRRLQALEAWWGFRWWRAGRHLWACVTGWRGWPRVRPPRDGG